MDLKKVVNPFVRGLLESLALVVVGWLIFRLLKYFGYGVFGILSFIIIVTLGFLLISIRNVRYKHESLGVFLSDMGIIITITILAFAGAYSTHSVSDSDYFDERGVPKELTFSEGVYFSIVTLSTLGYGDIVPRGVFRVFAATEALLGFLYLGIFVSGLTLYMTRTIRPPRRR